MIDSTAENQKRLQVKRKRVIVDTPESCIQGWPEWRTMISMITSSPEEDDESSVTLPLWMQEAQRRLRLNSNQKHEARDTSEMSSSKVNKSSPGFRKRRFSVKGSHLRKHSSRTGTPQQRRKTVSTGYAPYQTNGAVGFSSFVSPSRRLSLAVSAKPSSYSKQRRQSEPFVLDDNVQSHWPRRQSLLVRNHGRRRLSSASVLPTSNKHKLQALAKDELLATLNAPLSTEEEDIVREEEEEDEQSDEHEVNSEQKKRDSKRLMVLEEILETEKNYITCLKTLDTVFRKNLETNNLIAEKDLNSLFPSTLQNIRNAHETFMKGFEERMSEQRIIGDVFASMTSKSANLLEIYTAYVNSFPKSISTLSKCTRTSSKFRKFLEDCYENPVVERLDLPSFLLSPVQRLPRYILLLRELMKYTDEMHPDKNFIQEAMKDMERLISSLNSSIQNSMEFYSASDRRRKKLSRQLSSRKRKQRPSSTILRPKHLQVSQENKTDNDQGYCSLSERKDDSEERQKPKARSLSVVSATEAKSVVRRRNELSVMDSRKSWRRSIGAVFSNFWTSKDGEDNSGSLQRKSPKRVSSCDHLHRVQNISEDVHIDSIVNESPKMSEKRKNSNQTRRKVAITHTASSVDEEICAPTIEVSDVNGNIRTENIRGIPIKEDDDEICETTDSCAETSRKEEEESDIGSILEEEEEKQNLSTIPLERGEKLRNSSGPRLKSVFQKSRKLRKTLSVDEINTSYLSVQKKRLTMSLKKYRVKDHYSNEAVNSTESVNNTGKSKEKRNIFLKTIKGLVGKR